MKLITRFIDLLLYTSLFTACCATGLCMATEALINAVMPPLTSHLHLLVFGSTLFVYNTPRVIRNPYGRQRVSQKNKEWYIFFLFAGIVMTVAGLWGLSMQMLMACGILSVFAFAYFLPVLPFKNKKRLRDIGWVKIIVLAGVWTTATSILPVLYWQKSIWEYPYEILLRFVFIFTLCVIFDIRDIQADLRHNIQTIPQKVGINNSYRLINITLVLFGFLSVIQYMRYHVALRMAGALLTVIITKLVVEYLRRYPSDRAYLILADGVMLLYALLVMAH